MKITKHTILGPLFRQTTTFTDPDHAFSAFSSGITNSFKGLFCRIHNNPHSGILATLRTLFSRPGRPTIFSSLVLRSLRIVFAPENLPKARKSDVYHDPGGPGTPSFYHVFLAGMSKPAKPALSAIPVKPARDPTVSRGLLASPGPFCLPVSAAKGSFAEICNAVKLSNKHVGKP